MRDIAALKKRLYAEAANWRALLREAAAALAEPRDSIGSGGGGGGRWPDGTAGLEPPPLESTPSWTRRLPKQPGWYWYRNTEEGGAMPWAKVGQPVVLQIEHEGHSLGAVQRSVWIYHMDYAEPLTVGDFPGEWAGPIEPPKE